MFALLLVAGCSTDPEADPVGGDGKGNDAGNAGMSQGNTGGGGTSGQNMNSAGKGGTTTMQQGGAGQGGASGGQGGMDEPNGGGGQGGMPQNGGAGQGNMQQNGGGGQGGMMNQCAAPAAGMKTAPSHEPMVLESADAERSGSAAIGTAGTGHVDGYIDFIGAEGKVLWKVNAPQAGTYTIVARHTADEGRDLALTVNCEEVNASIQFNNTGSWDSNWVTDVMFEVELQAGENDVELATNGGSGPNIDSIRLVLPACAVAGETTCEAEPTEAYLIGNAVVHNAGSGHVGGYADMDGKEGGVAWLLDVPAGGEYTLTWRYTQAEPRDMTFSVNGAEVEASIVFTNTDSWDSNWVSDVSRTVTLLAGLNTVALTTNGGSGGNFDSMTIVPGEVSGGDAGAPVDPGPVTDGGL